MNHTRSDERAPIPLKVKDVHARYLQQLQEDTVTFCLGHTGYAMPKAYLENETIAHVSNQAYVDEIIWHASLPNLTPARWHWWDSKIQKIAIGMHFASRRDPNHAIFMQHWQPLFEKNIDKKPQFIYRNLLGYAWGNLLDMVQWVGECEVDYKNSLCLRGNHANIFLGARKIPLYGTTAGDDTRLFICDIDNHLVLDFHVKNLEIAHMLPLAARVCEMAVAWRVV